MIFARWVIGSGSPTFIAFLCKSLYCRQMITQNISLAAFKDM